MKHQDLIWDSFNGSHPQELGGSYNGDLSLMATRSYPCFSSPDHLCATHHHEAPRVSLMGIF